MGWRGAGRGGGAGGKLGGGGKLGVEDEEEEQTKVTENDRKGV